MGKRLADKGRQSRTVFTVNGKIETFRRWWYGLQIGSLAPADEILDCNGATITPGVLEMACRVNLSATGFLKAAAILERTAQVKLSGERLRQEMQALAPAKTRLRSGLEGIQGDLLLSRGRRTSACGLHARQSRQSRTLLRREADRLLFREADEHIGLVDGATWIRDQMELHLAELDGLGLDFFHLSENVHRARRKVFGDTSPEGNVWADALMHAFKHEGYATAWEKIVQWRATVKGKVKREAADRLLNFVSTRKDMIRYPSFRKHGWQIGSGPTESQCKLCTKRLKGYGRRWDRPNATAIAALDSLDRNGQWLEFRPKACPLAV